MEDISYAKYNFLHANVLFVQKQYREALAVLRQKWNVPRDKENREVDLRILTVMALMQVGMIEEAYATVKSLNMFIQRNAGKTTPRHRVILKLLLQAARKKFAFDKNSEHLAELAIKEGAASWQILTSGLIPIHEWVKLQIG